MKIIPLKVDYEKIMKAHFPEIIRVGDKHYTEVANYTIILHLLELASSISKENEALKERIIALKIKM